jgi:O-antigen/teichoic acid export membrane protein
MYFLTDAVTQVQDPIAMSALTEDVEAGKRQISEFLSVFLWTVLAVFLLLTLFSEEVLAVLTAPAYHEAYTLVGFFALAYVWGAIYRVFTTVLMYRRLLWVISSGAIVSVVLNLALMFALIPGLGRPAAAVAFLISTATYAAWIVWWSQRAEPVPLNWRVLGPTFAATAVAIGAYVLLEMGDVEAAIAVPVKVALMASYLGLIFVVPGMRPLRAGVSNQLRAVAARVRS